MSSHRPEDSSGFGSPTTLSGVFIDIGGSLAKVAYYKRSSRFPLDDVRRLTETRLSVGESDETGPGDVGKTPDIIVASGRLLFKKFPTSQIEDMITFVKLNLLGPGIDSITVTGGGAYKYLKLLEGRLNVRVEQEDEMLCAVEGCNFLLQAIPGEAFTYNRDSEPPYTFMNPMPSSLYPYLLVNIGSGVSMIKISGPREYERIGGTSLGGGTFWGLCSLLTQARDFDEVLDMCAKGTSHNVDMLVGDIYAGDYEKVGLDKTVTASSFGKAMRNLTTKSSSSSKPHEPPKFNEADIAKSLLHMISNNIGQIAYLQAQLHGLKRVFFGGYFIRNHAYTMNTISYAIDFWSKKTMQALFLRHEGYLGAVGAYVINSGRAIEQVRRQSWAENFVVPGYQWGNPVALEMLAVEVKSFPYLLDPEAYLPDSVDLMVDVDMRRYWLNYFVENLPRTRDRLIASEKFRRIQSGQDASSADDDATKSSNSEDSTLTGTNNISFELELKGTGDYSNNWKGNSPEERGELFVEKMLKIVSDVQTTPNAYGTLSVRSLFELQAQAQKDCRFVTDPWKEVKRTENSQAIACLPELLQRYDRIMDPNERRAALIGGILAGNVFDWGAKAVAMQMKEGKLDFAAASNILPPRPWLIDNLDQWLERLERGPAYKRAVIFVDNSGADLILGIIPFVVDLLRMGTTVVVASNSEPALNDVTYKELIPIVNDLCKIIPELENCLRDKTLILAESGMNTPCLDLLRIESTLVEHCLGADLVVLEGMGRAIHTNLLASFSIDCLKLACIKSGKIAELLGGRIYDSVCKFERP
eukprot:CFRG4660T1